tara:strand:- start:1177 stop:1383 length:207 start_codon:yes stop_codon:yes gene_type:complete
MCKVCGGSGVVIMPARVITYAIDDVDIEIPAHLDLCKKCVEKHELQFQKGLLEGRFDVTSNCGEKSKV